MAAMAHWTTFTDEAPELAAAARGRFTAHLHHVLATLRADGSPRLSGTEVRFVDGEPWLGSMPGAWKGRDLRRDPRFALHSAPMETDLAEGDVKVDGRATLVTDEAQRARFSGALEDPSVLDGADLFRLELHQVTLIRAQGEHLVIDTWRPGGPPTRVERR